MDLEGYNGHRGDGTDNVDSETVTKDGLLAWGAKASQFVELGAALSVTCVSVDVIIA